LIVGWDSRQLPWTTCAYQTRSWILQIVSSHWLWIWQ
jgi:hypothetical protein